MGMNKCVKISHKNLLTFVIIFFLLHKFGVITEGKRELLIHNILSNAHFVIQIDVENAFKLISKVIKFFVLGKGMAQWIFFSHYYCKIPSYCNHHNHEDDGIISLSTINI
jgi:hypothetical protein